MKYRYWLFAAVAMAFVTTSCIHKGGDSVKILRFDQFVFNPESHPESADDFNTPLLNYYPDDPNYADALAAFLDDPFVQHIYHLTDSLYGDLSWLEEELGEAMARARALCPEVDYERFYTIITADLYGVGVFCYEKDMVIDLDNYLAKHVPELQELGLPLYLTRSCGREYLLHDCVAAAARFHIAQPEGIEMTYLDYAVAEGKVLYFAEQVLPSVQDTIRLRYTADQLRWMKDNTTNVWGWLIQNNALFSNDHGKLNNLVDVAPKTNVFGDDSAPRTDEWIGWQIVRQYMKKSGSTISDLFAETDSRKILEESGWRP